jgi:hypothetical protein
LATVDPDLAMTYVTEHGDDPNLVYLHLARAHMAEGFEEVVPLIWQVNDVRRAIVALREWAEELRDADPDLARQCTEEALAMIETLPEGSQRTGYTASISDLARDVEVDEAEEVMAEAVEQAWATAPTDAGAYVRGVAAQSLCEVDLDAALDLVESIEDPSEHGLHLANIICRVAKTEPPRAVGLLGRLRDDFQRDSVLARALPLFPPGDFDMACKLADQISGPVDGMASAPLRHRAKGLGAGFRTGEEPLDYRNQASRGGRLQAKGLAALRALLVTGTRAAVTLPAGVARGQASVGG